MTFKDYKEIFPDTCWYPNKVPSLSLNSTSHQLCDNERTLHYNNPKEFWSQNISLHNKNDKAINQVRNPKMNYAPVITEPAYNAPYWQTNNLGRFSMINDEAEVDVAQMGYFVSDCCGPPSNVACMTPPESCAKQNSCHLGKIVYPSYHKKDVPIDVNTKEKLDKNMTCAGGGLQSIKNLDEVEKYPVVKEDYTSTEDNDYIDEENLISNLEDYNFGGVNIACGYNPSQIETAGLPSNLSVGNCSKDPVLKKFNENLFTQTVQPGVYQKNEVNEPINANIGISFTQQLEPTTCVEDENGDILYTEYDPLVFEPIKEVVPEDDINVSNVVDPRYTGYGPNIRAYTEPMLGQTRFYYDDIDAIRMPNYITRSNIDFEKYADTYGTLPESFEYGNPETKNIRAYANNSFLESSLQFRNTMMTSLMRKNNAENWQRRSAPLGPHSFNKGSC